jgi:hypothetical protein
MAENCIYDIAPRAPYIVLGSLVTPQANYLVVAECGQTLEQVEADLRDRIQSRTDGRLSDKEIGRRQQARETGDALMRQRDEAKRATEAQEGEWQWLWN